MKKAWFALIAVLGGMASVPAAAQSAEDWVHECGLLASSTVGPDRIGDGVFMDEIDVDRALPVCRKAMKVSPDADRLRYWYARSLEASGNVGGALAIFQDLAGSGYAMAQVSLGDMYLYPTDGIEIDYEMAARWYRKAAAQGLAVAQYNLGVMYFQGDLRDGGYREALSWHHKAAEQGYAPSQNNIGYMYDEGLGVGVDDREAVHWYGLAAEQGYSKAQNNLGVMYAEGTGVAKANKQAFLWFLKAAKQGNESAKENLDLLIRRLPVPADSYPDQFDPQQYCMDILGATGSVAGCI